MKAMKLITALVLLLAAAAGAATAQTSADFPSRPVKLWCRLQPAAPPTWWRVSLPIS